MGILLIFVAIFLFVVMLYLAAGLLLAALGAISSALDWGQRRVVANSIEDSAPGVQSSSHGETKERSPRARQPELPASPPAPSRVDQLERLVDMRASGALSDEEFQAEKARVLRGD